MNAVFKRRLGKSGIEVSAMGLSCWTIGGIFWKGDKPLGCQEISDKESTLAIQRALDLGIDFFDTAAVYGLGHSESVLGRALKGNRSKVVIATKFGYTFDVMSREFTGSNLSPEYIRQECQASLRRLETDYIDLYLLHVESILPEEAEFVSIELEKLCEEGYIRSYGWSTDDIRCARLFTEKKNYTAVEYGLSILNDAEKMLEMCEESDIASINRAPQAMGLLTDKLKIDSNLPDYNIQGSEPEWMKYLEDEKPDTEWLDKFNVVRDILSSGGRTLSQGALAWIWARGKHTIPIPALGTVKQVEENAAAMQFGPLTDSQMREIDFLLRE